MYLYEFKVLEYIEDEEDSRWQHGYLVAKDYTMAMKKLDEYFGENNLESIQLTVISDSELICLPEEYHSVIKQYNGF